MTGGCSGRPNSMRLILLPGLEGTGTLFQPFIRCLPSGVEAQVIAYPKQTPLTYVDLEELVRQKLPRDQPYFIVAESFSGPLGVRLAVNPPGGLRGLVLVSTFTSNPLGQAGRYLARLPIELICLVRPPKWLMRFFLLDSFNSEAELASFKDALTSVHPSVIARRVRESFRVNVDAELRSCQVPVTVLFSENDRLLGDRSQKTIRECRPDAFIATIRAPHLLLQKAPETAVRLMQDRGIIATSSWSPR